LVRTAPISCEPAADETLQRVLALYLPSELTTRKRFENGGAPKRLTVKELNLANGWLVIGVGPVRATEAK
jgi:hypothetical protein